MGKKTEVLLSLAVILCEFEHWIHEQNCGKQRVSQLVVTTNQDTDDWDEWDEEDDDKKTKSWEERVTYF